MDEKLYRQSRLCRTLGNPVAYAIVAGLAEKRQLTPKGIAGAVNRSVARVNNLLAALRLADIVRYETAGGGTNYRLKHLSETHRLLKALADFVEAVGPRVDFRTFGITKTRKMPLAAPLSYAPAFFPLDRASTEFDRLYSSVSVHNCAANILILSPRLLLLDEPSLGLSPLLVKEAFAKLTDINRALGTTMVIVEQKVRGALKICQRAYLLKMGRVAFAGASSELLAGDRVREIFL